MSEITIPIQQPRYLRPLVNRRGQILSRETILKHVWSTQPHITARTVDVHVAWLRQKIEDDPPVAEAFRHGARRRLSLRCVTRAPARRGEECHYSC